MASSPHSEEEFMILPREDFEVITRALGREPNIVEQGCFLNLWSEHCSYRSSASVLSTLPTTGERVLVGPGDDAAVVRLENGWALAIGMESHNHPSYVDPYNGAATGVGGIVRDILSMGARPIALMDPLYFGGLEKPKNVYLFEHVVAGIADYGNCIGVPVVRGEVFFHDSYSGNPLVNVVCIGLVREENITTSVSKRAGDALVLIGSTTGRDGLGGASFASRDLSSCSDEDRPSVQIGDPYTEKLLIEATLEAIQKGLVRACKDLGAAGLTGASTELAAKGGLGLRIYADRVPLREEGLTAYEILIAESQERMVLEVAPENVDEVLSIAERYDLAHAVVGELTEEKRFVVMFRGEVVVDVPIDLLVGGAPMYERESTPRIAVSAERAPEAHDLKEVLLGLLSSPNIASKEWVYRQYDHEVQIRTHTKPGEDAGVLVCPEGFTLALSCGCNPRHVSLSPYDGTALSVLENASNLAVKGAEPIAIVNCLNFADPEDREVYFDFAESVRGLAEAARLLGVPVVGGNVSFYNESEEFDTKVLPTPSIGMVGIVRSRHIPPMHPVEGLELVLVGDTHAELGGSEYCALMGSDGGAAPTMRREYVKNIEAVRRAVEMGLVSAAHDLSLGGLAVGVCKMAAKCGAVVELDEAANGLTPTELLFSESYGRFLLATKEASTLIEELGDVPAWHIGHTGEEDVHISVRGQRVVLHSDELLRADGSLTRLMRV
ncbi:MAG: phosphoribosylformylglycinamidine synthase subunit PurL [Methanosarcinales archaeon]|nr:MAG: Phosphoribosylformylglycinamidine synthase 2 [Euryarchaeota archaeon 55_53]KUK30471.1 MAG: Phosphoribosylformylglycinamidine synthase 2 [Methanosarcinales archeaon 56_1174]MDI3487883.1 phosphoribosylformylglycinamidine synthase subunit PurL [Methanosarcinales archaeon]MDN5295375.1 phosphoribosylformylglycinamidine synthase subunit PurL [Methanosarcinales archaeon]